MESDREGSRHVAGAAVAAAVLLVFVAWVGLGLGGERTVRYADDLGTLFAALAAALLCARAGSRQEARMRVFWWLLAAASAAWATGEAIWAVYDLILVEPVPVPSWADVGYLSGVPLAVAALLSHPSMQASRTRTARSMFDGLVVATALLFLSWVFVLGPIENSSGVSTLGGAVALAYPFGDFVIVWFVLVVIRRMSADDRLPLWCLLGGLLCLAFADTTYAYLTQVKTYTAGELLDAGWMAGYIAIATGAFMARAPRPALEPVVRQEPALTPIVAGFLPMLVALTAVSVQTQLGYTLDAAGLAMAFALVLVVLVRQGLVLADLASSAAGDGVSLFHRLHSALLGGVSAEQPGPPPREGQA